MLQKALNEISEKISKLTHAQIIQMSADTKISIPTIYALRRNEKNPQIATFEVAAKYLGVTP